MEPLGCNLDPTVTAKFFRFFMSDADLRHALQHRSSYSAARAVRVVDAWHRLGKEIAPRMAGPIAVDVSAGFTLQEHAWQDPAGWEHFHCFRHGNRIQGEESTQPSIVFWIPKILRDSQAKHVWQQKLLLDEVRRRYNLPSHHLSGFGPATLVAGLLLERYRRTRGQKTLVIDKWVRTDTFGSLGRLNVGWTRKERSSKKAHLNCLDWDWGEKAYDRLGMFPIGIETVK